ncbi:MAG: cellulase family glycosylhydrolase [Archangiaceae bacterium]|nr:cellulase family glycosylhydrolase [Archangiaceae bacterium]
MKLQSLFLLMMSVAACAVDEGEASTIAEQELDLSSFSFESSAQGWTGPKAQLSSAHYWRGSRSLQLTLPPVAGKYQSAIANPTFTSGTITAHLFVPRGAAIDSVQLFELEKNTWAWHSTYVPGSALTQGAWNTLQLTVAPGGQTAASIGLELAISSGWRGQVWIDSVQVPGVVQPPLPVDAGTPVGVVLDAGTGPVVVDAGTPPVVVDAGTPPVVVDAGTPPVVVDAGTPPVVKGPGIRVQGNHLVNADGTIWHGRGANLNDTRSCNACTAYAPNVAEVKRRVDELVNVWHANFIRLDLESYASTDGYRSASNYQSVLYDAAYLADVKDIVRYIGTKPGVQVLVSLWTDPSIDSMGRPTLNATVGTDATWKKLAGALADQPHAMFGVINEPQMNYDGSGDATVWSLMNSVVKAIRDTEDAAGVPYHVVTVQGTGGWARRLDYYATHPITERGGANVAYEVHVYNPATDFDSMFVRFASTLPIIIGEFGPMSGAMTTADCTSLMDKAQALQIPHLAWTFHMRCDPGLLIDNSGGACGVGMALTPSAWGAQLKARLAQPW